MEQTFEITSVNPVELFGVNHAHLPLLKAFFPKLKLVVRGNFISASGSEVDLKSFEEQLKLLLMHLEKYNRLTEQDIRSLFSDNVKESLKKANDDEVIVYGNRGLVVKARTANQRRMIAEIEENDMLFAVGPAGTGKTYTAVALAVRALKNKEVRKIILTRPAVEAGENLGFLPGDLKEKLDPYLQPLYDALRDMIPVEKLGEYLETGIIQIAPLAFMRGRTLDNAFVILDEGQNTTELQVKMFLTRMGRNAKFIITGDMSQVDLPKNQPSGLKLAVEKLEKVKGISIVHLDTKDVIRHKLVIKIIEAFK